LKKKFPTKDFVESLEDGVILCELANVTTKLNVPIVQHPPSKFKKMENVQKFVETCKQVGVKHGVLFDPPDLCDSKNLMKVVNCILNFKSCVDQPKHSHTATVYGQEKVELP